MNQETVLSALRAAFPSRAVPEQFTEHGLTDCWQCDAAEPGFRALARKLVEGAVLVRDPGADLLLLNAEGFEFLAPFLAGFALEPTEEAEAFLVEWVDTIAFDALRRFPAKLDRMQVKALCHFALWALKNRRPVFSGFLDAAAIEYLRKKWRALASPKLLSQPARQRCWGADEPE